MLSNDRYSTHVLVSALFLLLSITPGAADAGPAGAVYTMSNSTTGNEILAMMRPPYGDKFRKQIAGRMKK